MEILSKLNNATAVTITDAAGYFFGSEVESALAELYDASSAWKYTLFNNIFTTTYTVVLADARPKLMRINAAGTTITLPQDFSLNSQSFDFVCLNGADATFVLGASTTWDVTPPSTVIKAGEFVTAIKNGSKWSLEGDVSIEAHITDTTAAHAASAISVSLVGYTATDVAAALTEARGYTESETTGVATEVVNHLTDATAAHAASAISIVDAGGYFTPTNVEDALQDSKALAQSAYNDVNGHMGDALNAHPACAIGFTPTGTIAATDVQAAIAEVAAESGSGGAPTGAAGGVLGGTYPNPTFAVDMATQAELDAHVPADNSITNAKLADMAQATIKGRAAASGTGDPVDLTAAQVRAIAAYTASLINITDVSGYYVQTNVENALAEVMLKAIDTENMAVGTESSFAAHLTDTADAHDASAVSILDTAALYTATEVEAALAEVMTALNSRVTTKITVAATAPGSPAVNDLWVDTT